MRGFLVLETGETFAGDWRGGRSRAGEVVFNTSHAGYEEIATDPSYYSQIMVMTAPMQGNYGADRNCWESRRLWIEGFVSVEIQSSPRDASWLAALAKDDIGVLTGLDTREITMLLRDRGTPWGALVTAEDEAAAKRIANQLIEAKKREDKDWVHAVSRRDIELRKGQTPDGPRVALLDYGCKEATIRDLVAGCSEVAIFPSRASASVIREWQPDGIMLSNGPGDPRDVEGAVQTVRDLIGWKPVFGICMGHQILSLALGAKTYKLKFGHRGGNHPVKDDVINKIYVTAQNHGYAVDAQSLPADVSVSHVDLNDGVVEGISCPARKCMSVQYHPESHPGPREARMLFAHFLGGLQ